MRSRGRPSGPGSRRWCSHKLGDISVTHRRPAGHALLPQRPTGRAAQRRPRRAAVGGLRAWTPTRVRRDREAAGQDRSRRRRQREGYRAEIETFRPRRPGPRSPVGRRRPRRDLLARAAGRRRSRSRGGRSRTIHEAASVADDVDAAGPARTRRLARDRRHPVVGRRRGYRRPGERRAARTPQARGKSRRSGSPAVPSPMPCSRAGLERLRGRLAAGGGRGTTSVRRARLSRSRAGPRGRPRLSTAAKVQRRPTPSTLVDEAARGGRPSAIRRGDARRRARRPRGVALPRLPASSTSTTRSPSGHRLAQAAAGAGQPDLRRAEPQPARCGSW